MANDGKGKAADYKQMRCINMAKRGMLLLNVEWFNMGQLKGAGFNHYAMNPTRSVRPRAAIRALLPRHDEGLDILLSLPTPTLERVRGQRSVGRRLADDLRQFRSTRG